MVIGLALIPAIALGARALPDGGALVVAVKLALATATLGALPGVWLLVLANPLPALTWLELLGVGTALSLALAALATVVAFAGGVSASTMATALATVTLVAGVAGAIAGRHRVPAVGRPGRVDAVLLALVALGALCLYLKGSPVFSHEDQVHASMVTRAAFVPRPGPDNIYPAPGVVYTYPLAGIHFLMAMVSRLADVDPLFVYAKLRAFWMLGALAMLALAARLLFESAALVRAVMATATLLLLAGAFADVPGMYWGQLAPVSHPSDVAMNVLLPGAIVASLYYLRAAPLSPRLLGVAVVVAAALILVHIREVPQLLVYLVAFGVAVLIVHGSRDALTRSVLLAGVIVLLTIVYLLFHRAIVTHVVSMDVGARDELIALARRLKLVRWVSRPLLVVGELHWTFYGWFPVALLAGPAAVLAFGRRTLILIVAASVLVYLLLMRLPLLTFPYVYLTYWEILLVPVRNVAFFAYLLAGIGLYLVAANLARIERGHVAFAAAAGVAVLVAVIVRGGYAVLPRRVDLFFLPALALYAAAFVLLRGPRAQRWGARLLPPAPHPRLGALFVVLLLLLAGLTAMPASSPLALTSVTTGVEPFPRRAAVAVTPSSLVESLPCIETDHAPALRRMDGTPLPVPAPVRSCPPPSSLGAWAARHLAADTVLVANAFSVWTPTLVVPHHVLSGLPVRTGVTARLIYPTYWAEVEQALDGRGVQPFFNTVDDLEERVRFLQRVGATHVVVDPMYYPALAPLLATWPERFRPVFDERAWAVYEVVSVRRRATASETVGTIGQFGGE